MTRNIGKLGFYWQFWVMALKVPVYASRITSLSDARYFAGMGVQYLGICADADSFDHFPASLFREVSGWITGPLFVLEVDTMNGTPDFNQLTAEYGVAIFRIAEHHVQAAMQAGVRFGVVADVLVAGADFIISSNRITEFTSEGGPTVFMDGILSADDAEAFLDRHPTTGIVVLGSPEQAPGLKAYDAQDLLEFLDADQ